ncbi:hypothetical protein CM1200mP19_0180 [bacterium]|nr:MAG: hypothetical protein CM1200mP19_0180 [bacterium]
MRLSVLAGMLDLRPRGLKALASVDDFERAAKRKLPRIVSDFCLRWLRAPRSQCRKTSLLSVRSSGPLAF